MGVSRSLIRLVEDAKKCPYPPRNETEDLERRGIYAYTRLGYPQIETRYAHLAPGVYRLRIILIRQEPRLHSQRDETVPAR